MFFVYLVYSGDSPLSSLLSRGGERISSPNSSARRQLFSPGSQRRSPTKPIPIAPKPPQRGVTITPLAPLKLLSSILQQQQLQAGATSAGQQTSTAQQVMHVAASPSRTPQETAHLVAPSTASTGTQTSPLRPLVPASLQSPTKPITVGTLLSPDAATSPPLTIPTVTLVPSPSKTPQRGPGSVSATPIATPSKPKRTGSLALFYRKVYSLAFVRIKDLCDRLGLERDAMQK